MRTQWAIKMGLTTLANRLSTLGKWLVSETTCYWTFHIRLPWLRSAERFHNNWQDRGVEIFCGKLSRRGEVVLLYWTKTKLTRRNFRASCTVDSSILSSVMTSFRWRETTKWDVGCRMSEFYNSDVRFPQFFLSDFQQLGWHLQVFVFIIGY